MSAINKHPSSYRDPSGFIFYHNQHLYRQVNKVFEKEFEKFQSGGLYHSLADKKLLIPHTLIKENKLEDPDWHITLQPEFIPMISYPAEWSFDMLKDAALLTLEIVKEALSHGMMLKDASAYNVQFFLGKMVFIDSLSFESYDESKPWIAYRQFCEHFLAPLALMHYLQMPLHELWNAYPEGIPLKLASKMLPFRSKFNLHTYLNIHLHASLSGKKNSNTPIKQYSSAKFKNVLRSLEEAIHSFTLDKATGVWSNYYDEASQRNDYMQIKKDIILQWVKKTNVKSAIDAGANDGFFAKLLADIGIYTLSADLDHYSVNQLYKQIRSTGSKNLQPLIINLAVPTPSSGVNNNERPSFIERVKTELVLALALIHHLSIAHNIPFQKTATLFRNMGKNLIIEFVPKSDEKVSIMLIQKKDIYSWYTQESFEAAYSEYFQILDKKEIEGSGRTLYLMQSHGS